MVKETAHMRRAYVGSLRAYLGRFAKGREQRLIASFTVEEVEQWFDSRNESNGTRMSNTGRLSALFSFAVRRGWMENNPCRQLEPIRVDRKPPSILSPDQASRL